MQSKMYCVNEWHRFNLDDMLLYVMHQIDYIRVNKFATVFLMGETMGEERLEAFEEELVDLICKAHWQVCRKDFRRIKAISEARNVIRYANCIANAGYCFFG